MSKDHAASAAVGTSEISSPAPIDWPSSRVIVTGGHGFLGSAVVRALRARGCDRILAPRRAQIDLTTAAGAARLFDPAPLGGPPTVIIHAAAAVGGIQANLDHPARFIHDNAAMALHLVQAAVDAGFARAQGRLVFVSSAAAYPARAPVPLREDALWDGPPEGSHAPYGVAKRFAHTLLDAYHREHGLACSYLLPINLYGPGDHFDPRSSHVVPALVRRFVEAAERQDPHAVCWGTGSPTREFLYVDDAADAVVRAADLLITPTPINLGTGVETSIRSLTETVARLAGYQGEIRWDTTKPDGQPRRSLDTARAREKLGWTSSTPLEIGVERTIAWFRANRS
jgi:GDP-L-fucose synthase